MRNHEAFTSSKDTEYETPSDLYSACAQKWAFTIDAAATAENAKCSRYYTKETNGLAQSWAGETVWLNPPYGEPENLCKRNCLKDKCIERGHCLTERLPGISDWCAKAVAERHHATIVMLLPVSTATNWWWDNVAEYASEIIFLKGKLRFVGAKSSAFFGSAVVVFNDDEGQIVRHWDWKKDVIARYGNVTIQVNRAPCDEIAEMHNVVHRQLDEIIPSNKGLVLHYDGPFYRGHRVSDTNIFKRFINRWRGMQA